MEMKEREIVCNSHVNKLDIILGFFLYKFQYIKILIIEYETVLIKLWRTNR